MKKILFCCFGVLALMLFLCAYLRPVNFRVNSIKMQRVSLKDSSQNEFYLLVLELKHCNEQLYFGSVPYPGGIIAPVTQIKVFDERRNVMSGDFKGFSACLGDSIETIWISDGQKEVPCHYCKSLEELRENLNAMTENIRGEYFVNEDDAHYMYRLFCIRKGHNLPKKLFFCFGTYSLTCNVNNMPAKIIVVKIDKMPSEESYE